MQNRRRGGARRRGRAQLEEWIDPELCFRRGNGSVVDRQAYLDGLADPDPYRYLKEHKRLTGRHGHDLVFGASAERAFTLSEVAEAQ